jgi:tetratricopeptide (TPR) repeat protein
MAPSPDILQYRRDLQTDPRSLRFVPLAEALRRSGELHEARQVLASGLRFHPGFRSAIVVQAKVFRDLGRRQKALSILDELYPRDSGNVALVEVYFELLVDVGRLDDAEAVLRRTQFTDMADSVLARLEEQLEEARSPDSLEELDDLEDISSFSGVLTLPGLFLEELGDPFAVPIVAARVSRVGHRAAAKAIWREVARLHPAHAGMANRQIARLDGIAGRIQPVVAPTVVLTPAAPEVAASRIRAWAECLRLEI